MLYIFCNENILSVNRIAISTACVFSYQCDFNQWHFIYISLLLIIYLFNYHYISRFAIVAQMIFLRLMEMNQIYLVSRMLFTN